MGGQACLIRGLRRTDLRWRAVHDVARLVVGDQIDAFGMFRQPQP